MARAGAHDVVGAHVSTAGGLAGAPLRARAIGARAIQIFTKTPNQWRERTVAPREARAFRDAARAAGIVVAMAHDSYLINLASPDRQLRQRSMRAFTAELRRARLLGLDAVVSHPGNFIDDRVRGLARNADACTRCLRAVPGPLRLLLETTAGAGTVLGSCFEELAELRERIGADVRDRVGFCADTCHLFASGYDLVDDFDGVWVAWDRILGLPRLGCLHLNDSLTPKGSRRDRHALIGEGTLGPGPFRAIMTDARFRDVPKIIETPKGPDGRTNDRRMLRLLRGYAGARRSGRAPRNG